MKIDLDDLERQLTSPPSRLPPGTTWIPVTTSAAVVRAMIARIRKLELTLRETLDASLEPTVDVTAVADAYALIDEGLVVP